MTEEQKEQFNALFYCLQMDCTIINEANGWQVKKGVEPLLSKIALIHSELSEAVESVRNGTPPSDHIPEFSGLEEEFADVILRILHIAQALHLRLPEAMYAKLEFNKSRGFKHNGKLI